MTYDEFIQIIVNSEPSEWIYDDAKATYILKKDLCISIVQKEIDYEESGRFYEDWATSFPDNKARKAEFELCYNGNEIETFYTAYVDGMRMAIPYPKIGTETITNKQYQIGKIINIPNEGYGFESYLAQANITVG